MHKTNAMRTLDSRDIAYIPFEYSADIHSGEGVAERLGESPERVFKTLVAIADGVGLLLVIVPSNHELDLKQCAAAVGVKRLRMATRKEAESKTGLLAGGISALALLHKPFPVYLDHHAILWDDIWVSAGQRGYNLKIAVQDLVAVTKATIIEATNENAG